ncbi:MAG: pyridoxine 5'-phosphate synthase, partial [Candidatus Amulumruptor sp.]|nr:pyridoxine 5'-phosphate synthase [Candidatus Amulumruptor sp.]
RSSIFVPADKDVVKAAARVGADRVELYTKPYADRYPTDPEGAVAPFAEASKAAHNAGLGVNAGHDLNLDNLAFFAERVPYLNEVSIGHAIISDALYLGIDETIRRYRECLKH